MKTDESSTVLHSALRPWIVGYALWWAFLFSNGVNGPSWMPLFQSNPTLAILARALTYSLFAACLAFLLAFRKRIERFNSCRAAVATTTILTSSSFMLLCLAGYDILPNEVALIAAPLMGAASSASVLPYWWKAMGFGAKRACICMSFTLALGAALYLLIAILGAHMPFVASAIAALCPLASLPFLAQLRKNESSEETATEETTTEESAKVPFALPLAIFVYGIAYGLVLSISLNANAESVTSLVMNAAFVGAASIIVAALALATKSFSVNRVYRLVFPVLGTGFILLAFADDRFAAIAAGIVLAGYALSRIFAATILSDMTCRSPITALQAAGWGTTADACGIAAGSMLGWTLVTAAGVEAHLIESAALLVGGAVMIVTVFLVTEQGVFTLWGMAKPQERVADDLETRARKIAAEHSLTPRETEVFLLLASGKTSTSIAEELVVAESTVRTHTKKIYAKLGVHSRMELVTMLNK